MTELRFATFVLVLVGFPSVVPADQQPDRIEVTVVGLRSQSGHVLCALHNSARSFPGKSEQTLSTTRVAVDRNEARCAFETPAPGTYAVSVVHDENDNFKLDTNLLGIPREGVGVSNDARGFFGPPHFEDAAFRYAGGVVRIVIHIRYL